MKNPAKPKKRNPQDATLRNIRALRKAIWVMSVAIEGLNDRLMTVEGAVYIPRKGKR
jgi:hypothetical protein